VAHETAVCRSPHTLSNSHSHITTQFGHRYTFCQNVVSTNNGFSLYFRKSITCFSVGPLRICPVPYVCCQTVYRCVTTYCYCMRHIAQSATCFGTMWVIIRKNHSYKRRIWHGIRPRVCLQTIASPCISVNRAMLKCWSVEGRSSFTVCCRIVYRWVTTVLFYDFKVCHPRCVCN